MAFAHSAPLVWSVFPAADVRLGDRGHADCGTVAVSRHTRRLLWGTCDYFVFFFEDLKSPVKTCVFLKPSRLQELRNDGQAMKELKTRPGTFLWRGFSLMGLGTWRTDLRGPKWWLLLSASLRKICYFVSILYRLLKSFRGISRTFCGTTRWLFLVLHFKRLFCLFFFFVSFVFSWKAS